MLNSGIMVYRSSCKRERKEGLRGMHQGVMFRTQAVDGGWHSCLALNTRQHASLQLLMPLTAQHSGINAPRGRQAVW